MVIAAQLLEPIPILRGWSIGKSGVMKDRDPDRISAPDYPPGRTWHLDKRFPIAVVITLIGVGATQIAAGSWWASALTLRMEIFGERLTTAETNIKELQKLNFTIDRMDQKIIQVNETLNSIRRDINSSPRGPGR